MYPLQPSSARSLSLHDALPISSGAFRTKACGSGTDFGRVAIGQECHLSVTPLQLAEVAATIGNGGVRMKPRLDRKSTRLNSSHLGIAYGVFRLKKKQS